MDLIIKCTALWINVLVCDYRLLMKLGYAAKLLTFVNDSFSSEMLATRSLVQIDVVNEKMVNCEFLNACLFGLLEHYVRVSDNCDN